MADNLETLFVELGVDAKKLVDGTKVAVEEAAKELEKLEKPVEVGGGKTSTKPLEDLSKQLPRVIQQYEDYLKALDEGLATETQTAEALDALTERLGAYIQEAEAAGDVELAEQFIALNDTIVETSSSLESLGDANANLSREEEAALARGEELGSGLEKTTIKFESAAEAAEEYTATIGSNETRTAMMQIAEFADKTGVSLGEAGKKLIEFGVLTKEAVTNANVLIAQITAPTKKSGSFVEPEAPKLTDALGAAVGRLVGQYVSVQAAMKAVSSAYQYLNGLIQESIAYTVQATEANVRFGLAIRNLQRDQGTDIGTIKEWSALVAELSDTYGVGEVELKANIAETLRLAQAYGFSKDQLEGLIRAGVIQGEINGQGAGTLRTLAFSLQGYERGLRQVGIQITDVDKQQAALRLGIKKTAGAYTDAQTAAIMLEAIIKKVAESAGDAELADRTLAGSLENLTNASNDASKSLGGKLLPAMVVISKATLFFRMAFKSLIDELLTVAGPAIESTISQIAEMSAQFIGIVRFITAFVQSMRDGAFAAEALAFAQKESAIASDAVRDAYRRQKQELIELGQVQDDMSRQGAFGGAELPAGDPNKAIRDAEEVAQALLKYSDAMEQIGADFQIQSSQIAQAYTAGMAQLTTENKRALAELNKSMVEAIADLEKQVARARASAIQSAAEQLQKLEEDVAEQRQALQDDFHTDQIRSEEDFQTQLRRLRESYLDTLEDAVRNRDARAVLNAKKQYERARKDLIDDHGVRRRRELEDYNKRLQELERNERERRQEIQESLEKQLRLIDEQQREQRQLLAESYNRQLQQLRNDMERQRAELYNQYQRQRNDLINHTNARLYQLGRSMASESAAVQAHAIEIFRMLTKYWGIGGQFEGIVNAFRRRIQTIMDITITYRNPNPAPPNQLPNRRARGGSIVANQPTTVTFGEAGAEVATFTPLQRPRNLGTNDISGDVNTLRTVRLEVDIAGNISEQFKDELFGEIAEVVGGLVNVIQN